MLSSVPTSKLTNRMLATVNHKSEFHASGKHKVSYGTAVLLAPQPWANDIIQAPASEETKAVASLFLANCAQGLATAQHVGPVGQSAVTKVPSVISRLKNSEAVILCWKD